MLSEAISACNTKEALKLIAEAEADSFISDLRSREIIFSAIQNSLVDVVIALADKQPENVNRHSFHFVCKLGQKIIVEKFISINPGIIKSLDPLNRTPLHVACLNGHIDIAKLLYDLNPASANEVDVSGETILHAACRSKNIELVKMVLELKQSLIDQLDKKGKNVLHVACEAKSEKVINVLIHIKPELSRQGNRNGQIALKTLLGDKHAGTVKAYVMAGGSSSGITSENCSKAKNRKLVNTSIVADGVFEGKSNVNLLVNKKGKLTDSIEGIAKDKKARNIFIQRLKSLWMHQVMHGESTIDDCLKNLEKVNGSIPKELYQPAEAMLKNLIEKLPGMRRIAKDALWYSKNTESAFKMSIPPKQYSSCTAILNSSDLYLKMLLKGLYFPELKAIVQGFILTKYLYATGVCKGIVLNREENGDLPNIARTEKAIREVFESPAVYVIIQFLDRPWAISIAKIDKEEGKVESKPKGRGR